MFNPQPKNDADFHFPLQCIWLKLNGSWPLNSQDKPAKYYKPQIFALCYELWSWYVVVSVGITIIFQATFLFYNLSDIIMTTENCCTTFMGALNFVRLLHLRLNQRKFKTIIEQFVKHIWIVKNSNPQIERACEKNMNTFRVMTMLLVALILMYCILPLMELFSVGWNAPEKPFPYKMIFPYKANQGWRYIVTYLFTSYAGLCVVTTLFAEDSLFGFFVTYTCGQFRMLHQRIDSIIPRSYSNVSLRLGKQELPEYYYQQEYKRQLDLIAQFHRKLIKFADGLDNFMSPILLVNFTISSILICMVGFQLVTGKDMFIGDYIKFIIYISSSLSQLYILCWNGDMLIKNSADTAWHLYACNWQGVDANNIKTELAIFPMDTSENRKIIAARSQAFCHADADFQRRLKFMILRSQKPVRITALKFSELSLQSFTKILSTSMSYFTLLQTVYDEVKINPNESSFN